VARTLDPETREALVARVRFYRDLGLTEFYRRPVDSTSGAPEPALSLSKGLASETWESIPQPDSQPISSQEDQPIPPASPSPRPRKSPPPFPRRSRLRLQLIRDEIGDCTRCALHTGRNKLVFGDGSPSARLMFVGEGPGADEDAQGLPFVGKAGQLLNNMIAAMGLKREEVYIANVVKCRPPGNRTPEPEEANTCSPFLFRQIDVVRPRSS